MSITKENPLYANIPFKTSGTLQRVSLPFQKHVIIPYADTKKKAKIGSNDRKIATWNLHMDVAKHFQNVTAAISSQTNYKYH